MRRLAYYLAAAVLTAGVLAATASPAHANIPVTCGNSPDAGWYVNDDEGALAPTWSGDGLKFNGPGLVHHAAASPPKLADLKPGTFADTGLSGARPLLKYETSSPYSTVNQVASGVDEFWSSKIPSGEGSQNQPVTIADLATLAPYTPATTVSTFGIGYAHDAGNADTITSITFAGTTYSFAPCPTPPAAGGGPTPARTPAPTHAAAAPTHTAAGNAPAGHPAQAGQQPAAASSSTVSSPSPEVSESYDPLGIATAAADPGYSVGPAVPAQVTPMVPASDGAGWGWTLIGTGLVLGGVALVVWLLARRRRNGRPVDLPPATPYSPGVARDLSATTEITAVDEQGGRHGERS